MSGIIEWPEARIAELLDNIELASGHHEDGESACAMDLIGMAIDGEWTDTPDCVHPIVARAVHRINDDTYSTEKSRRRLVVEVGPLIVGTSGRSAAWAVLVSHMAGKTVDGLLGALESVPLEADLSGSDLSGARLSGSDLSGSDLSGSDLSGARLSGSDLSGARLSGSDLSGARLSGSDLSGAHLSGANLSGAHLSGAHLSGAHLSGAHLSGANLSGAIWSLSTVWPSGFDPEVAA